MSGVFLQGPGPDQAYFNELSEESRAHASTCAITHYLNKAAWGYLVKIELDFFGDALHRPKLPFAAIIGGAEIAGKS